MAHRFLKRQCPALRIFAAEGNVLLEKREIE
jgi:hypothetical protein